MTVHVVSCVSDEVVFEGNLGRSLGSKGFLAGSNGTGNKVVGQSLCRGVTNVNRSYNEVIRGGTGADWWMFVHEDVYFPDGWLARLFPTMECFRKGMIRVDLMGVAGVDKAGVQKGHILNRGIEWGSPVKYPQRVRVLDECVVMMRAKRSDGPLYFDERAPNHHLGATDLCLRNGDSCFVVNGWCEHNRRVPHEELDLGYLMSCGYYSAKWSDEVYPLVTTCSRIEKSADGLLRVTV